MSTLSIDLSPQLLEALRAEDASLDAADRARQLVVLDLFRRHVISTGTAARELGIPIGDFLRLASTSGIPVFDSGEENLEHEIASILALGRRLGSARAAATRGSGGGLGPPPINCSPSPAAAGEGAGG